MQTAYAVAHYCTACYIELRDFFYVTNTPTCMYQTCPAISKPSDRAVTTALAGAEAERVAVQLGLIAERGKRE